MKFVNDKHVYNRRISRPHRYSAKSCGANDIRLVSDPNFYKNAVDNIGGTYKKELIAIDQLKNQYGYSYNSATKTYFKNQ